VAPAGVRAGVRDVAFRDVPCGSLMYRQTGRMTRNPVFTRDSVLQRERGTQESNLALRFGDRDVVSGLLPTLRRPG
jgi:hypothetical protein